MSELPSKRLIGATFGKKASTYSCNARVQSLLLDNLTCRIQEQSTLTHHWIDIGCGTSTLRDRLHRLHPEKNFSIFNCDLSFQVLQKSPSKAFLADCEHLPLKDNRFEGCVTSSVLQWIHEPSKVFNSIYSILLDKGIFAYAIFTEGSFIELFSMRKKNGLPVPLQLYDDSIYVEMIKKAGFEPLNTEHFTHIEYFPSAYEALKSIHAIGGTAVPGKRLTRDRLTRFCKEYEDNFATDKGIPVTYRAITGLARKNVIHGK